jgi:PAS domain S-box-containing protein
MAPLTATRPLPIAKPMFSGLRFLDHPGEMATRIRRMDWSSHPMGPPDDWPQALRFALNLALSSSFPTAIYWGPEYFLLYNDAWSAIPADRHPWALGRRGAEVWSDIWDVVGPLFERTMQDGQPFAAYDQMLMMERNGVPTETYWNYSGTPLRDEHGAIVGIFNQGNETTRHVLAERARVAEIERLQELFHQSPGAVVLLNGPDHRIDLANDSYLQLIGRRDVVGKTVAEALPEIVDQGFVELLDNVYQTGKTYRAWGASVMLERGGTGAIEERILDFVYQPIRDASGAVTSIFVEATDVTERALAERALRESEARLQLALEASQGVGTWDWDVVNDRVVTDAGFARLYGVEGGRGEQGAPITDFFSAIHPEDADRVRAAIDDTLLSGKPFAEEYRLVQPDGSNRWVIARGQALRGETGELARFPGVTFDITQRKLAEEAARHHADELRAANESQAFIYALAERQRALDTPQAIMRFTAAALGRRLKVDRVGFYRLDTDDMLHYGPSWTSGTMPSLRGSRPVAEIGEAHIRTYRAGRTLVVDDTEEAPEFVNSSIRGVARAGIGVPLLRAGRWIATMYLNHAEPRGWSAEEIAFVEAVAEISWDAVERVGAVAALRESEAKFRAITDTINHMVWSTRADGQVDYFNRRWYEFTGTSPGETEGDQWVRALHPDDIERARAAWSRCVRTGEPYQIEYRMCHADGGHRWVRARGTPVHDDNGETVRWFGTCTDIQDIVDAREVLARSREQLEQAVAERTRQLMTAEEQLRQAQKMEAVGQLTGGIAHDFNNMLAVVIGALDLMERRIDQGSTDVKRYILAARDGASRAAGLTQRLLSFARQTPLAPKAIDIDRMIGGMLDLLVRTIGDDIRVDTRLHGQSATAIADPSQLENVVLNLAVNARDAMPRGGTLTIATEPVTLDGDEAAGSGLQPGDYIRLTVQDTGDGMSPEVAARAFEPFFTTKAVGKGTGLGLSQVFGFVRQSGGHVQIDTAEGRGTTVHVLLPCGGGEPREGPAPYTGGDAPRARSGESVLVVEDEDRVRNFSIEALRDLGYRVVDAASGPDALALIDQGERPSLLFTDVVMPEMTGPELAGAARERIPALRILYTSGYTGNAVLADTPAEIAARLLPKPFNLRQLGERVRAALDE